MMAKPQILKDLAEVVQKIIHKESKKDPEKRKWDDLPSALRLTQEILTDGTLRTDFLGRPECRSFVLNESSRSSSVGQETEINLFGSANIEAWLQLHLHNKDLTQLLRDRYSNKTRLNSHYRKESISRDAELRQTFLLILESLEHLDLDILTSLNILKKKHAKPKSLKHKTRKSTKETNNNNNPLSPKSKQLSVLDAIENDRGPISKYSSQPNLIILPEEQTRSRRNSFPNRKDLLVNKSENDLSSNRATAMLGVTTASETTYLRTHARARSDTCAQIVFNDTCDGPEVKGTWSRVVPASTGWYPQPRANQSLLQFLSESVTVGRAGGGGGRAELDRENAHFVLSETVISTFEQLNCDKDTTEVSDDGDDEDDEEIKRLQMEIKRRRNEKKLRKERQRQRFQLQSDGVTDTAGTTDQSASPGYSDNDCNHDNTDDILDSNDEDFMEAETKSTKSTDTLTQCSAECIALSLLSQVGSGRLPPVDKLSWLVSRDMVDQDLLPLPSSVPVDPDLDMLDMSHVTEIRGTLTWAPPRPQIVLTVQNIPAKRTLALSSQRWMCAGCGMKVEQRYCKSFRWCHYLGKYFCTGCHSNNSHVIPARIIHQWNFRKYPVSNFALEILKSMKQEPVFNIQDLNPGLVRKVEKLRHVVHFRSQLSKLARYVSNCRLAGDLEGSMDSVLVSDIGMYSLEDMCSTRAGLMVPALTRVFTRGLDHVTTCQLCQARGHICTICNSDHVIFPFMTGVYECGDCFSCYHKTCYNPDVGCSKCWRRMIRNQGDPASY